ncbi:MAG: hypothetical protein M1828_004176 [Chrysothrix sp. TS-e1954]|nr:MAG: hypothetical protein M1828_004176 [Chrysothrix sp. TS-e1954]
MTVGAAQVVINGGYDRNQYLDDAYLEPGTCSSSGYCMKGETDTVVQVELAAGVLGTVAAIVECALVLVTLRQARKTWKASRNQARMEISPENQKTRPIAHEDPQSPPELATPSSLPSYYATAQYQYPLLQQNAALAEYSAKSGHRFASSPPGLKSQGQLYGLEHPAFRHELNHFDGKRSSYVAELGATEEVRPDRITTRADRWSNGEGPDRLPERNKDHDVDSPISPI